MANLTRLASFVAVADELNFGRAARRLHISQPALSQRIRLLEQEIGTELLARSSRRVSLTLAGMRLFADARDLLRSCTNSSAKSFLNVSGHGMPSD